MHRDCGQRADQRLKSKTEQQQQCWDFRHIEN
jgi:hypothetical protein